MRIRKTFVMNLNPGCEEEYRKRHDNLWPEMKEILKRHGVHNYSISVCAETNQLFAYLEIYSEEEWNNIATTKECQEWWRYMSDIMETNEDSSPKSVELREVFYME